ncbi:glycosyltransferase [candidate division CSSED10-310 bacterium]|uniref:Glycosyltransferase n=1 Tax=candidate division CSSED10-310 bacterium TaxID=2855610 RepID=A0ABV6YSW4_UNCC1
MMISIEIPVIKGGWLTRCLESVLGQTSADWRLSLLWDGGDELSRNILENIKRMEHPSITVYFHERLGIANARRFLSERSSGDFILPVDDDDILTRDAVDKLSAAAERMPWCGIIRARRGFIDEQGNILDMQDWFPFEPRHYYCGMTSDLFNHSHPYIIRRCLYERTSGWEGFPEYLYAGEDCDIFTKLEEYADIGLLDEILYYYRINPQRTSKTIGNQAAEDMWRRIADKTIKRRGLPLKRINDGQPFRFERVTTKVFSKEEIDVVIPFWDAHEEEIPYDFNRPSVSTFGDMYALGGPKKVYRQVFYSPIPPIDRLEIVCSSDGPVSGVLEVAFFSDKKSTSPMVTAQRELNDDHVVFKFLSIPVPKPQSDTLTCSHLEITFFPDLKNAHLLMLHIWKKNITDVNVMNLSALKTTLLNVWTKKMKNPPINGSYLWMRMFRHSPNYTRNRLECCLQSLNKAGISEASIYVIEKKQSCAANRNQGVHQSSKPLICFADDDVEIINPNTFNILLEKLHSFKADMVGPKIITPLGLIFCADPYFNEEFMPHPRGLGESDNSQYDYSSRVPWLPTTLMVLKREVILATGGFDEQYIGSQHEDVDFCLKARSRGFQICYVGGVAVKHYNCSRNSKHHENYDYFVKRWEKQRNLFDWQT